MQYLCSNADSRFSKSARVTLEFPVCAVLFSLSSKSCLGAPAELSSKTFGSRPLSWHIPRTPKSTKTAIKSTATRVVSLVEVNTEDFSNIIARVPVAQIRDSLLPKTQDTSRRTQVDSSFYN